MSCFRLQDDRAAHAHRVAAVKDGTTVLASYDYLGTNRVVRVNYEQPQVRLDLWGGTSGTYAGMDYFGRVIDQRWIDYGSSTDVDRFTYGYDRDGNRDYSQNMLTTDRDDLYAYDGLNRLTNAGRGDLNTAKTGLTTKAFGQDWGLDPLGNWSSFNEDDDGDGTNDLAQSRTHDKANEITDITETAGAAWVTPVHDHAGNMTTLPKPKAPTESFTATYDAWNRLVKITDQTTTKTVAEYAYGGRGRRIVKKTYVNGVLDETRHFYYSSGWQILEERVGSSTNADRQFIWGLRYIDALVCRFRDTNSDGVLDERLYVLQDANFDVTALANTSGAVVERYRYTPYGRRTVLDPNFSADSDNGSDYGFHFGHQGLMHDSETGLIYNRNRMYHPSLGRFMQHDPAEYVDGLNLYEYLKSNPLHSFDPTGLFGFNSFWGWLARLVGWANPAVANPDYFYYVYTLTEVDSSDCNKKDCNDEHTKKCIYHGVYYKNGKPLKGGPPNSMTKTIPCDQQCDQSFNGPTSS